MYIIHPTAGVGHHTTPQDKPAVQSSTWMSTCHHLGPTSDHGNNIADNDNTNKN